MPVDDAHAIVRNALSGSDEETPGLHDLRIGDLNETEREHAIRSLRCLHRLDEALAERSDLKMVEIPWDEGVGGDA